MKVSYFKYPEDLDKVYDLNSENLDLGETRWFFNPDFYYEKIEILSFPGARFTILGTGISASGEYEIGPSGRYVLEDVNLSSIALTDETVSKINKEFERINGNINKNERWLNETNDIFFAGTAYCSEKNKVEK